MDKKKLNKPYKEVVVLSKITHNGVGYLKGDVVRERVILSEKEAKANNANPNLTGCEYLDENGNKPMFDDEPELTSAPEEKPLNKMNKTELHNICKEAEYPVEDWEKLTNAKLIDYIEAKQE